jgi:RNA recognition motif-containing protein
MQIYVGNLPESTTDAELRSMFEKFGQVRAATIGRDKKTGQSQGYGFVEMAIRAEARAAVDSLRGKEMGGKPLRVRILKPGDDFHQHAMDLHGGGQPGVKVGKTFRGDVNYRGSGAIRRSGRRGS